MSYTKEEFIETREDVLDALCEFINCTNGIYVTQESSDSEMIDLEPPVYITHFANIKAPVVYSLPVFCTNANIFINISDSTKTEIV
jgi:CheY-specific phosphatase CheX